MYILSFILASLIVRPSSPRLLAVPSQILISIQFKCSYLPLHQRKNSPNFTLEFPYVLSFIDLIIYSYYFYPALPKNAPVYDDIIMCIVRAFYYHEKILSRRKKLEI